MREGGRKRRWVHVLVEGNERGIKGGRKEVHIYVHLEGKERVTERLETKKKREIEFLSFYFILGSTVIGLMPIVGCSKSCKNMSRCITPLA